MIQNKNNSSATARRMYGQSTSSRRGFTIVELLIVVVVIAILAAITIVAYNGIQNRAKASAAQAAVKQGFTKVQSYAIQNADQYPADLDAAGLTNSGNVSYQYRANNSATPKSFCITATASNVSYYISNVTSAPTVGACAGHGADGRAVIANLATNPSVESDMAGWNSCARCTPVRTAGTLQGNYFLRITAIAPDMYVYIGNGVSGVSPANVAAGDVITASATYRNVQGGTRAVRVNLVWRNSAGTALSPAIIGASTAVAVGGTTRLSVTGTAPAGVSYVQVQAHSPDAIVGDVHDFDGVMITAGTEVHPYLDGDSQGWYWNGDTNNSSSTGPRP